MINFWPLPQWCFFCQRVITKKTDSLSVCGECMAGLPLFPNNVCACCFKNHSPQECIELEQWGLDDIKAIFYYSKPLSTLLTSFKYEQHLLCGRILKRLFSLFLFAKATLEKSYDYIIPVPSFKDGFIPKLVASQYVGEVFTPKKFKLNKLIKTKDWPHQVMLDLKSREKNMAKANIYYIDPSLAGKNILLFDDVCTTGATLKNLVYRLKQKKVRQISALTVFRDAIKQ